MAYCVGMLLDTGLVFIDSYNTYFSTLRNRWGVALREAFAELPDPDWLATPAAPSALPARRGAKTG